MNGCELSRAGEDFLSQSSLDWHESRGLLDGNVDIKDKNAFFRNAWRRLPRTLQCIIVISGVVFLLTILTYLFRLFTNRALISQYDFNHDSLDNESRGQIAIPLHPERHITRTSSTLEFRWNITKGLRSPDGVQKAVYLVNGTP